MKPNKLNGLWLAACLAFAGQAEARYYDDVISSGYIRIGVYRDFPPYSFVENGTPTGVDIEIGRRIAKALEVDFRVHWITPDENLDDDLRNNVWKGHYLDKNDAQPLAPKQLADVMMRVPYDREYSFRRDEATGEMVNEQVVMFGPYQREGWRIAFDTEKLEEVSTVAVFQYHPIGVEIDSLPAFYLTSAFQGRMRNNTHHFPTLHKAFAQMQQGKVDAVMGMRSEVDWQMHKVGDTRYRIGENGFPMIGRQKWDLGMAIKHSYRQLGYAVEEVVDGMIRSGEMEQLFGRYGLTYELPGLYQTQQ
ncbi:substrate-binding periplasmic protein [Marinobacterium jannaschii]|uniref:substrate-binding periplasmic protein n=1 Tax=Marinobacterium jannaschii TaxID=64970 RepID=UPI0004898939|nr:transporter substrate-binding domain-containing protein [Marinobacterium jannaschii]